MILTANDRCRFLAYVMNKGLNECWEWLGSTSHRQGYGQFRLSNKMILAHRVAYYLEYNIDPGHLFVCHRCDNTRCCNPNHLFLGVQSDNLQDAIKKDRFHRAHGERNGNAKLTKDDIIEIRRLLDLGLMQTLIAEKFNISRSTITDIKMERTWRRTQ